MLEHRFQNGIEMASASEEAHWQLKASLISSHWSGILKIVKRVLSSFHRFMQMMFVGIMNPFHADKVKIGMSQPGFTTLLLTLVECLPLRHSALVNRNFWMAI